MKEQCQPAIYAVALSQVSQSQVLPQMYFLMSWMFKSASACSVACVIKLVFYSAGATDYHGLIGKWVMNVKDI